MTDYTFEQFIFDVKCGVITSIDKMKDYANSFLFNISEYGEAFLDEEAIRSIEEKHND